MFTKLDKTFRQITIDFDCFADFFGNFIYFLSRRVFIINIKTNVLFPSIKMCLYSITCCVFVHYDSCSFPMDDLTLLFLEVRQKFSSQKFCRNCRRLFRWINILTKACELIELKMNWSFSGFSTEMNRFIWKYQLARCGISFLFLQSKHPCL